MNINQVSSGFANVPIANGSGDTRAPVKNSTASSITNGASTAANIEDLNDINAQQSTLATKEPTEAELKKSVEQINHLINANNGVSFKIDQGSGRMVVQVVDHETNTVIRQIPSKEIIEISKALEGKTGVLLKDQA